jgi:protein disulfide-isomerase
MKPFIFTALLLIGLSFSGKAQSEPANASGLSWHTDLSKAMAASDASRKPIFGFFTGSDWCGWCRKLQSDVFSKSDFIQWANKNVVLLELDFPRRKQLPEELAQQNQALQQAFKIRGYPTIWIFYATLNNATNNVSLESLGSLGYPQGAELGKEEVKFLTDANAILAKGKK